MNAALRNFHQNNLIIKTHLFRTATLQHALIFIKIHAVKKIDKFLKQKA